MEEHQGEPQLYTARILASEQKQLPLNILEALYIEKQIPGTTMNDKNEAGRGGIVRLRAVRGEGYISKREIRIFIRYGSVEDEAETYIVT